MKQQIDNARIEEIYTCYKDMVYRIAYMRMKQPADVDDVFQDVFIRLVKHVNTLKSDAHIRAWLIRVTINCCNARYANGWIKHTILFNDQLNYDDLSDEQQSRDDYMREYEQLEDPYTQTDDRCECVMSAVKALNERDRTLIYLFYYEEMSIREIAASLGETEGAIKTRLSRARGKLSRTLKEVI